jgi:hypothetical protein
MYLLMYRDFSVLDPVASTTCKSQDYGVARWFGRLLFGAHRNLCIVLRYTERQYRLPQ